MKRERYDGSILIGIFAVAFLTAGFWLNTTTLADGRVLAHNALLSVESAVPQNAGAYLHSQKITYDDGGENDDIGYSVAISGNYAVVGAPLTKDKNDDEVGAAHVFVRDGANWDYLQTLSPDDDGDDDLRYGFSVDIDGDTIIVGAPFRTVNGADAKGSAYIYTLSEGTFGSEVELLNACDFNCESTDPKEPNDNESAGEYFGISVAVDGDTAVVGAYGDRLFDDNISSFEGSATRFNRSMGVWPSTGTKTPGVLKGATFGISVSVSGDLILIGASSFTSGGANGRGAAYRYGSSGIGWGAATPTPTYLGEAAGDNLGNAVAIYDGSSKDVALMGASGKTASGSLFGAGAAYISESTSFGSMSALSHTVSPNVNDKFGYSVAIDEDMIVVGTSPSSGDARAHIFRDTGSGWVERKTLYGNRLHAFATAVGVDKQNLIIGEYNDPFDSEKGSASIFVNTFTRVADRNGDGATDISVYRPSATPSNNFWHIALPTGTPESSQFGTTGDLPAPMDFDGDGKMDLAVFRPSGEDWYVLNSSTSSLSTINDWGLSTDILIPQDFDHDGKTDIAVYRPSTNYFYWRKSADSGNTGSHQIGTTGDKPVRADMDGDGFADPTVFRSSNGTWYWYNTVTTQSGSEQFGSSGDVPVSGDFDGDLKTDLAVFRPSTSYWYIEYSSNSDFVSTQFGSSGDIPASGDYDGDGEADIAVFRPSTGYWHILRSRDGSTSIPFGTSGDIPLPAAYNQ